MSTTPTPIYPQTIKNDVQSFTSADTTVAKTLSIGGAFGSKLESILVQSNDTAARDIVLSMLIASVSYILAVFSIPANSGNTNALPCVDILRHPQLPGLATDAFGNKYLYVASGTTLQLAMGSTITAAKQVNVFAQRGDY